MNKDIDAGEVLHRKTFSVKEQDIDMDYVLDPAVRAKTLVEYFIDFGSGRKPKNELSVESNTFYIIHPVLKHLAILKQNRLSC